MTAILVVSGEKLCPRFLSIQKLINNGLLNGERRHMDGISLFKLFYVYNGLVLKIMIGFMMALNHI